MGFINEKSFGLGNERSVIRDIFEYGNERAKTVGRENVYDFSLGNPAVPTPDCINDTIKELVSGDTVALHGYTSAAGAPWVREAIAKSIEERFDFKVSAGNLYMTCGAAASLTCTLNGLVNEGDEVIAVAPFFPEYKVFIEASGAKIVIVPADEPKFQINFDALKSAISEKTRAIIINSPNNPTGAVLTEDTIKTLAKILSEKSKENGSPIFLISDEPYRELAYGGAFVPYIPKYYNDTIVCYSYSKSLSLAGERIGYIMVSPLVCDCERVYAAICGAGRKLGFVCAPSLMQQVVGKNPTACADLSAYVENRNLLYDNLTEYGYDCVVPDGAFYLFVKLPYADFVQKAKEKDLLVVPSDSFGISGYMRISYCVSNAMIKKSLPVFKELIKK